ncbi:MULTISPECIES: hypothetical protein [Sphingomonas]|uniref:hypothetical protein n=1 Tax=Sphingomonas TaxID=13687 RepID=UPI0008362248|nr:hypothetical protein [Sphingomonas sp. CCH10-B3]MBA3878900.1 hypothetical protein [Sphingobium sp.]
MLPDRAHLEIIARELAAIANDIETIGAQLCSDDAVVSAHATSLQAIDLISQRQMAIARLIVATDFDAALAACTLGRTVELFEDQRS